MHLLEHLRLTQLDILNYLCGANDEEPAWPQDYWTAPDATTDETGWNASIGSFETDLAALIAIVQDPATDLTAGVPSQPDHTVLREILIVADHHACHIGEVSILRQVNGIWGQHHENYPACCVLRAQLTALIQEATGRRNPLG